MPAMHELLEGAVHAAFAVSLPLASGAQWSLQCRLCPLCGCCIQAVPDGLWRLPFEGSWDCLQPQHLTAGCGAHTACRPVALGQNLQFRDCLQTGNLWLNVALALSAEGAHMCVLYPQARHPQHPVQQPCAGKIGDDADFAKVQVDKRLPEAQQESVRNHFKAMFGVRKVDGDKSRKLLAAAYHDVCARHKFC